jgi:hypothetical protein
VLAHEYRAVGRRKTCDQVSRLEEPLVERSYLVVGRRLELFPVYNFRLLLIGGSVELGQAVASVPADRAAMGSGANNTARYVGSGIGITIVTVLLTRSGAAPGVAGLLSGWNVAVFLTVGFSLLGALVVLLARERRAKPEPFLERRLAAVRLRKTTLPRTTVNKGKKGPKCAGS